MIQDRVGSIAFGRQVSDHSLSHHLVDLDRIRAMLFLCRQILVSMSMLV